MRTYNFIASANLGVTHLGLNFEKQYDIVFTNKVIGVEEM
jgi:hypothetical protein